MVGYADLWQDKQMDELNSNPSEFNPDAEDFFADEIERKPPGPLAGKPGYHGLPAVIVIYLCTLVMSSAYWSNPSAKILAVSYDTAINEGKWWQLFTALFVHSNLAHLLSNTPMFAVFGYLLRSYFGSFIFPIACVSAGMAANYLTILNMPPKQYLVGMSGMIYAMVSLWLTFYLRFETQYAIGIRLMRATAFSLVLMFPTTYNPTTSYLAHGWGFILGIILGLLLGPFVTPRRLRADT